LLFTTISLFTGCSNKKYEAISGKLDSLSNKIEEVVSYAKETRDSVNVFMPIAYSIRDTGVVTRKGVAGLYGKIKKVGNKVDGLSKKIDFYKMEQDSLVESNEDIIDEQFASAESSMIAFKEQYGVDMDSLKKIISKTQEKTKKPKWYFGTPVFGWVK